MKGKMLNMILAPREKLALKACNREKLPGNSHPEPAVIPAPAASAMLEISNAPWIQIPKKLVINRPFFKNIC